MTRQYETLNCNIARAVLDTRLLTLITVASLQVRYDVIGKYETMGEDAAHVIDVISRTPAANDNRTLPAGTRFPAGQRRANRTQDVLSRFNGMPAKLFNRLTELYESDFELFGYEYQLLADGTLAGYRSTSSPCPAANRVSSDDEWT